MNKFKSLLSLVMLFSLAGCSHNVTKDEALKVASPIIASVLEYKKTTKNYPSSLMDIKNFPYKIEATTSIGAYEFLDKSKKKQGLILYAGGFEARLSRDSGFIYHIQISFTKSRGSRAVTSIFVGFREDSSYEVSYSRMPPAFKQ